MAEVTAAPTDDPYLLTYLVMFEQVETQYYRPGLDGWLQDPRAPTWRGRSARPGADRCPARRGPGPVCRGLLTVGRALRASRRGLMWPGYGPITRGRTRPALAEASV